MREEKLHFLMRANTRIFSIICISCFQFFALFTSFSVFAKEGDSEQYKYQLAACLMFQNETFFLKEWIEYHKMMGFEHFYLCDNASNDDYFQILKPYLKTGEVELFQYSRIGKNQAEHNYNQCNEVYTQMLKLARGKAKWLAIIDADEFIVPLTDEPLLSILNRYENYGGLYLNYLFFGTSHVKKKPKNQLIIETFNHCSETPIAFGKSIVRPERVKNCTDPHRMWYRDPFVHVDTNRNLFDWTPESIADDVLLLFHYYTGDENHVTHVKFPRRSHWEDLNLKTYLKKLEYMNARENNHMQKYVPELKKRMKSKK